LFCIIKLNKTMVVNEQVNKQALIDKNKKLKDAYINLQYKVEQADNYVRAQLEALYYVKIGALEVELFQLQLSIKALKIQIEHAYKAINKNETPNFEAIEQYVDELLVLAQIEILEKIERVNEAKIGLQNLVSNDNRKGIHNIYKRIAKQIHPDVNPNFTEEQYEVWCKVQDAYKRNDLEQLQALELAYDDVIYTDTYKDIEEDELVLKNEILLAGIKELEVTLSSINDSFPFNLKDKLTDDEWVTNKQAEVNKQIEDYTLIYNEKYTLYTNIKNSYVG
jgi:hypothetical protein